MSQSFNQQSAVKSISEKLTGAINQYSSNGIAIPSIPSQSSFGLSDIGYRRIKGYVREDLYDELIYKLKLRYVRGKGWIYLYNNAEIIFTFNKYRKTTCIDFSISKLLYKDRIRIATPDDATRAIELICNLIGRDFSAFNISRFDITSNFKSLGIIEAYRDMLRRPSGFSGYTIRHNSVIFHNRLNENKSTRLLIFYKTGGVMRVEARFTSAGCASVKEQIKKHIGHNSQISEMLTKSFYDNCVHYFYDLVLEAINYNCVDYSEEVNATIKNLQDNYDYTYEPKHKLELF